MQRIFFLINVYTNLLVCMRVQLSSLVARGSAFFTVHLSHPYVTTGKTIALTSRTLVGKVMSLLFKMLSRLLITFLPRRKRQTCRLAPFYLLQMRSSFSKKITVYFQQQNYCLFSNKQLNSCLFSLITKNNNKCCNSVNSCPESRVSLSKSDKKSQRKDSKIIPLLLILVLGHLRYLIFISDPKYTPKLKFKIGEK